PPRRIELRTKPADGTLVPDRGGDPARWPCGTGARDDSCFLRPASVPRAALFDTRLAGHATHGCAIAKSNERRPGSALVSTSAVTILRRRGIVPDQSRPGGPNSGPISGMSRTLG